MGRRPKKRQSILPELGERTWHTIYAIFFLVVSLLLALSAFGQAGIVGEKIYEWLFLLLGFGYYLILGVALFFSVSFFRSLSEPLAWRKIITPTIFVIAGLSLLELVHATAGGLAGKTLLTPLLKFFDIYASFIILVAVLVVTFLITFDIGIDLEALKFWKRSEEDEDEDYAIEGAVDDDEEEDEEEEEDEKENENEDDEEDDEEANERKEFGFIKKGHTEEGFVMQPSLGEYVLPPISLLSTDKGKPGVGDIKANANIIKRTLANFGIRVEMDEISVGPSITRYALKPAEGVKLARIVGLQSDLSLALAAHPLRIEAPIPGKALVGIEIPNSTKTTVGLGTLLASAEFQNSEKPVLATLGKGISGKALFANIAKMPHLLVAGTTGSGKSALIHMIVTSLLYKSPPDKLRFIMVDPKRVELTLYNKIPHLLTPAITDPKKAILALKWAVKEMERRYDILEAESVRDIDSYHKNVLAPAVEAVEDVDDDEANEGLPEAMPYIVVIIDELADIMQAYPRELEAGIVRLAQMSRAVGIHLILSTQRPSVNVITGLIKANVPSRIALQVASQIDSRTILDTSGAEKLLGAGDMLFLSGEMAKPVRIQSGYISEDEVKKVVKFLSKNYQDEAPDEINLDAVKDAGNLFAGSIGGDDGDDDDDDLYEEARETVLASGKASTSYLQRKLRVGYARAARLIDMLEERGVIGPANGSKPREVYKEEVGGVDEDEYEGDGSEGDYLEEEADDEEED